MINESIILLFFKNHNISDKKNSLVILLILVLFNFSSPSIVYATDNGCIISGEVQEVRLGSHNFKSNNKNTDNIVSFTELTIKLNSSETPPEQFFNANCEKINQQKTINVGLCEEQTIIVGDIIKGDTGGWENGPDCIIDVKFIYKAERKEIKEDD